MCEICSRTASYALSSLARHRAPTTEGSVLAARNSAAPKRSMFTMSFVLCFCRCAPAFNVTTQHYVQRKN